LIRECPLNKRQDTINPKTQQDEEGFITPNPRNRANKKQHKTLAGNTQETQETQNTMEGRDQTNKGTTEENDSTKTLEVKDQATKEPTQQPNITTAQRSCATPMDGETKEDNTTMQDAKGDAKMTPSEVDTEDPDLRDLVEREGIDLPHILEQWKRQGVNSMPIEQLDYIQYLFLLWEEAKARGQKCTHGEIGHLGVKAGEGQSQPSPKQTRRKKGRKSNIITLQELGALLINSGNIKKLFPHSPPHV
jgi:hypothetical protein